MTVANYWQTQTAVGALRNRNNVRPLPVKKCHWYSFVFFGDKDGKQVVSTQYSGFTTQSVTVSRINDACAQTGLAANACLISVSYLGLMTEKEFKA